MGLWMPASEAKTIAENVRARTKRLTKVRIEITDLIKERVAEGCSGTKYEYGNKLEGREIETIIQELMQDGYEVKQYKYDKIFDRFDNLNPPRIPMIEIRWTEGDILK